MITILSYGSGNIAAFVRIFQMLGIPFSVAQSEEDLKKATKLILPGVGAFDQTLQLLEKSSMLTELNRLVLQERMPVLGVCVGMQIMAESSEEGTKSGLGWIQGKVRKIDTQRLATKPFLPHMGWNEIRPKQSHKILANIDYQKGFYFLHSYHFQCGQEASLLATCQYGFEFAAAVHSENIFGFQFHPEKSHDNGIQLFRNFANL
jgi:imidazole glycerol-phosphate synthase subunit HisH